MEHSPLLQPPRESASSRIPRYDCFSLVGGLQKTGREGAVQKVALYALTGLAVLTGIGGLFWIAVRSKIKAEQVGLQFFSILGTVLLALTPVVGWGILYGIKHLVVARYGKDVVKLQSALSDSILSSVQAFSRSQESIAAPLACIPQFTKIQNLIEDRVWISPFSPWSVSHSYDRLRRLRTEINALVGSPEFQAHKQAQPRDPFTLHILALCHLVRQGGTTTEPFIDFGKLFTGRALQRKHLRPDQERFSLAEVSDLLSSVVEEYRGQNHETLADSVAHRVLSPTKAIASLGGETHPKDYNSYLLGNMDNIGWRYQVTPVGAAPIDYDFHYGPGPQSDQLMQADLDLYRTLYQTEYGQYKGPLFVQHNLQKQHGPEGVRSKSQHEMSIANPHLLFLTTPMDGDIWKLKGGYSVDKYSSIESFCAEYHAFAHGIPVGDSPSYRRFPHQSESPEIKSSSANGYYLPEILTDEEIRSAFGLVGEKVTTPLPSNSEEKRMVLKGCQLLVQASLLLKTLAKSAQITSHRLSLADQERLLAGLNDQLKALVQSASLGQACKQDIDRGMALNLVTRLLVMKIADQPITRAVLDEVVGEVIGRAEMVDRRLIMLDRLNPALCALHLIDENEAFTNGLQAYLGATIRVETT